ncbi:hypothetical protein [Paraburkholderia sp. J41]|uniref:hypothetical protein n=1 Tax=Paraburkholderia sp. J41 TaxID=2805433 RepID=UPI002AC345CE|nr:hypothetical protein [Paraburkholderia sp. J41]
MTTTTTKTDHAAPRVTQPGHGESARKPRAKRARSDTAMKAATSHAEARARTGSIALSFAVVYRDTKPE